MNCCKFCPSSWSAHPPGHVGIVSFGLHLQKPSQVRPRMLRTISGLRLETPRYRPPDVLQAVSQAADRFLASTPSVLEEREFPQL